MNIQKYQQLIKNPKLLNSETLKEIEDLVSNFPMVENFRILLALNLLILNDYRYDSAITNAAIYASDRRKLKEWVDVILNSLDQKEKILEASEIKEYNPTPTELSEEITQETKVYSENEQAAVIQKEEKAELVEPQAIVNQVEASLPKEAPEPIKKEITAEEDLEEEKKRIRSKKELLKLVRKRLNEIEAEKSQKVAVNQDEEKNIQAKLIDRFIEQEPRISRPDKNDFFDPQTEAVESSIDEDDFFVTETLAQIHTQQANLKKAKEIYQKLILKYPEKSSYFAAQIEKLTKK